jgi:hypothetical protein
VQVTAGPTAFIENDGKVSVGAGPVSVSSGSNHALKEYSLRTAVFDLGTPEGQRSFDGFRQTGRLPEQDGNGVSNAVRIDKLDYEHKKTWGIDIGPLGAELEQDSAAWESALVHNPDGTKSLTLEGKTAPECPTLTVQQDYDKDGKLIPGSEKYALQFDNIKDDGERYNMVLAMTNDPERAKQAMTSDEPLTLHLTADDVRAMKGRFQEAAQRHPGNDNRLASAFEHSDDPSHMVLMLARNIQGEQGIAKGLHGAFFGSNAALPGTLEGG